MELNEKNSSVTNQTGTSSLARAEATPTIVREETESLTPPTPVARKDRIFSLDVIRGVALLGILLVNIENFAGPEALHDIPVGTPIAAFSGPHAPLHLFILMDESRSFSSRLSNFGVLNNANLRDRSLLGGSPSTLFDWYRFHHVRERRSQSPPSA